MRFMTFSIFLLLIFQAFPQSNEELIKKIEESVKEVSEDKEDSNKKLKKILDFVNAQSSDGLKIKKEIALCNYLIEQACILEALDGRGVGIVRKELTENINDHGLSNENKRYLRRLVELCEEAERSYSNVNYVEVDGSEAKADLLVSNIGAGVGISLALGDVTPLIASAVRIGRGYSNINKTKSRQLQTLIQSHKARITNFLFTVNSFKNDLVAEKGVERNQIITPDSYRDFLKILIIEDYVEKLKKLEELNQKFPGFKAVQFYLGEEYLKVNKNEQASVLFNKLVSSRNPIIHKDGFVGQAYTSLAGIALKTAKYDECIDLSSKALKENVSNGLALHYRSESYLAVKNFDKAYTDAVKAETANSENSEYTWNVCKIASIYKENLVYFWLKKALEKGFKNFDVVKKWPGMQDNLKQWEIKSLLIPRFSAQYKPGVFKDDIIVTNTGYTAIDNLKLKMEVRYFKKDKWEHFTVEAQMSELKKGGTIDIKNKFSMPKESKCSVQLIFSSDQNPLDHEYIFFYNFEGKQQVQQDWEYNAKKAWPGVIQSESVDILKGLKDSAVKINEKSFYQNPNALSLLAQAEYKLGNKKLAIEHQKKAISLMKRDLSPDIYSISVKPLEQALKKFEE